MEKYNLKVIGITFLFLVCLTVITECDPVKDVSPVTMIELNKDH